ncbi:MULTISPECIES: hydantoinase/oxoprolinase family protein [Ramlibacter]|uniref:Hydantoinase/oxoprolinase family protein n=1 Tax=Ramlibacter pinisoli TaxID=2682844 RepID=A0A6N8IYV5_9BURK|nr:MULTISPECIES: hydantoinase/oxoprolinase family protein [Ramlibacter]MBA2962277.1 hydantoinase/oxoprolinase family protein [Ramlibacter sp. CGMCC 1.13660]MVQ32219.1 hydantoinase/oxoprolinase family protein [Ramlibacter pinisoli]
MTADWRVGVEVGGTFTDLVALQGSTVRIAKVPSVPGRPEEGVFAAFEAAGIPLAAMGDLVHGSTVATNAVLERKGALTALLVTQGFADLLLVQRQDRPKVYELRYAKPAPVVQRRDVFEVPERRLADGSVAQRLDLDALGPQLDAFLFARPYQAVAICLLNAYVDPAHEQALAAWLRRHRPDLHVSCSSEVSREFREYERASTTALSAYVQPVIDRYLGRFEERLQANGFRGRFSVMQSNGGRLPAAAIRRNAITALFSGPAGGVTGAVRVAGLSGYRNLITLDMGGTSTDVCLVADGQPAVTSGTAVDGLPVRTPVVDIASVGAGGGSIVWSDSGGMLHVGPRSAGADPGPACYGRGGVQPTITDAHVVRGTIRPKAFLGGRMALDAAASRRAFEELAATYRVEVQQMADDAVRIADANVVRAVQLISTELGEDPRDYVLVPFGGAGPLHAARIAEELGIATVVIPADAGVLSAFGLVAAEFTQYEVLTRRVRIDAQAPAAVREVFATQRTAVEQRFAALGVAAQCRYTLTLQMRFVGQAFELDVPVDPAALPGLTEAALQEAFLATHEQVYFSRGGAAGKPLEIVGFRLGASAPEMVDLPRRSLAADPGPLGSTEVYEWRTRHACAVATRGQLLARGEVPGPLLLEDETATIYVPPGWSARNDDACNLVLQRKGAT